MSLLDKAVTKNEAGTWDFQCPGPVDSPCGTVKHGGPGFASIGWPSRKTATARGAQHFAEHRGEGIAQPMHEFLTDQGLAVAADGSVVRVEDLA